jgi:hypothetical protein
VRYYVNLNEEPSSDHDVHTAACSSLPLPEHRLFVGDFDTCGPAIDAARKYFATAKGCARCSSSCNTG